MVIAQIGGLILLLLPLLLLLRANALTVYNQSCLLPLPLLLILRANAVTVSNQSCLLPLLLLLLLRANALTVSNQSCLLPLLLLLLLRTNAVTVNTHSCLLPSKTNAIIKMGPEWDGVVSCVPLRLKSGNENKEQHFVVFLKFREVNDCDLQPWLLCWEDCPGTAALVSFKCITSRPVRNHGHLSACIDAFNLVPLKWPSHNEQYWPHDPVPLEWPSNVINTGLNYPVHSRIRIYLRAALLPYMGKWLMDPLRRIRKD